jgi:hypothetical protein
MRFQTGDGVFDTPTEAAPNIGMGGNVTINRNGNRVSFNASRVVPTADENRGRNLAYPCYIYAGHPA